MLFILSGGIQTGKTRWLMCLIEELSALGATCHGVVSPGIWCKSIAADGSTSFEKLGIEAMLLPQGERLTFARRCDLASGDGEYDSSWQSMQAGLGWVIPDAAIEMVNRHFDGLEQESAYVGGQRQCTLTELQRHATVEYGQSAVERVAAEKQIQAANQSYAHNRGLLVVDELGKLELTGGGFTSALRRLEAGPSMLYGSALAVVRNRLLEQGREVGQVPGAEQALKSRVESMLGELAQVWGGAELIAPDAHCVQRVISAVISGYNLITM